MKVMWYLLSAGKLHQQPVLAGNLPTSLVESGESWFDVQDNDPEELRKFLTPLDLHPVQLTRCLDSVNDPGVVSFGKSLLMEFPAAFNREMPDPSYLTLLLQDHVLVTVRHGEMEALDDLVHSLTGETPLPVLHLPQIIYMILDQFADLNVDAQVAIRDQILLMSNTLAEYPGKVSINDLSRLRAQVENLVSLVENQLYCISGLNASDNEILRDPHRKAYIQDLLSETEIMQSGVYRLENRVKDLYNDYQAVGNERVEKRLRLLTIVSTITLPLGLLAGLLGMNVGGVPGTKTPAGFIIVIVLMVLIILVEAWYFTRKGWFD
ncbi:MAG: CorA family divalent cation transporter [Anaerolineales bacterium]